MKTLANASSMAVLSLLLGFAVDMTAQGTPTNDCTSTSECAQASKVGADVQTALQLANGTGLNGLVLSKAVLTLETGGTNTAGISINLFIFTIKHQTKKSGTLTQEIDWGTLQKPAGGGPAATLQDVLAKAISSASSVAAQVTQLPLSQATITIQFAVDKDNGGSLSYKIAGIDLGPNIDFDKTSKNTLVVTFTKPQS